MPRSVFRVPCLLISIWYCWQSDVIYSSLLPDPECGVSTTLWYSRSLSNVEVFTLCSWSSQRCTCSKEYGWHASRWVMSLYSEQGKYYADTSSGWKFSWERINACLLVSKHFPPLHLLSIRLTSCLYHGIWGWEVSCLRENSLKTHSNSKETLPHRYLSDK